MLKHLTASEFLQCTIQTCHTCV